MQYTGERNLTDLEKEICAWQIITGFFFLRGNRSRWARRMESVEHNWIFKTSSSKCHIKQYGRKMPWGKRGPRVD